MHQVKIEHGIRTPRGRLWVVEIVATVAAATMTGSCFFGTATNLCASGRRCNPGQTCAANQDVCIDIGSCGDGIVNSDKDEVCDDGNIITGDGCSADCRSDETCGNNIIDTIDPNNPKETCDDGNRDSGDGCSADCFEETCGDGIYNPLNNEQCDTKGDTQACNGASGDCTLPTCGHCTIPRCGDGYTNTAFTPFMATGPEQCDAVDPMTMESRDTQDCNGNHNGFDGPGSCRKPLCGDGYPNPNFTPPGDRALPEQCDTGGDSQICNGNTNENNPNKQGIGDCAIPSCGDAYFNPEFKPSGAKTTREQCDTGGNTQTCNGNDNENDAAEGLADCAIPQCGDGYVNPQFTPPNATQPEECDTLGGSDTSDCDGNNNGTNGPGSCRFPSCGDGYKNPLFVPPGTKGEQCDQGPQNSDTMPDTCRTNCQNPFCGDGVRDPDHGEACDKGGNGKPEVGCGTTQNCNNSCTACVG